MIKLSADQFNSIAEKSFIDELEKIALKIPFSGGMNIPHNNLKNLAKDLMSADRYNVLDTMKFAPGVRSAREGLAKYIKAKRSGAPISLGMRAKATAAETLRKTSLGEAPIAAAALSPITPPGTEPVYVAYKMVGGKMMDMAKKKGWIKPSLDMRPKATRSVEEIRPIMQMKKLKQFDKELRALEPLQE